MSTSLDEITRAQQAAEQADAIGREARTRLADVQRAAEAERQERRREVWRRQLAEIESTDYAGEVRRHRADLSASIRGDLDLDPLVALYRLQVAERRLDRATSDQADLQASLRLPVTVQPTAPKVRDAMRVLADVIERESVRTVQEESERRRSQVEAAWHGEDLPAAPRTLDPSRYIWLQDGVGRARTEIAQLETKIAQTVPIDLQQDEGMIERQKRARQADQETLAALREHLEQAERALADFQAGK